MTHKLPLLLIIATLVAVFAGSGRSLAGGPTPDRVVDTFFPACIDNPNTYTSIRDAVTDANPGDEIFVCPGPAYVEKSIDVTKSSVKILGPGAFPGMFGGPATVRVSSLTSPSAMAQFEVSGDSVRISGLDIDGTLPGVLAGPLFGIRTTGQYDEVSDNTFEDTTGPAISNQGTVPVGLVIQRNQIQNQAYAGIYCICSDSDISHNDVTATTTVGGNIGVAGAYNTVTNNTSTGAGIEVYSDDTLVDSNIVDGQGATVGMVAVGNPITVSNNHIMNSALGLQLTGFTDLTESGTVATVIKNTFENNNESIQLNYRNLVTHATIGGSPENANTIISASANPLVELKDEPDNIDATYNNWGLCTLGEIEDKIVHKPDNPALGLVDYDPFIPADGCPTASPTPTPTTSNSATPAPTTPSAHTQGDTNCDGHVTALDGLPQLLHDSGAPYAPPAHCPNLGDGDPEFGDVNCDGEEDSADTLPILEYVAAVDIVPPQPNDCTAIGAPLL